MKNETSTVKSLVAIALLDISLVFFGALISFDFRADKLAKIDELNRRLIFLEGLKSQTSSRSKMLKDNRSKIDRLNLYFITKETIPNFIEELELAAGQAGVSFKLSSLLPVVDDKQPGKPHYLKLSLETRGAFANVFRFTTILERLPYQVRFNKVALTKLEEVGFWRGDISADLTSYTDK